MRLRELHAHFIGEWDGRGWRPLLSIHGAQGVFFQCPKCADGLPRGGNDIEQWVEGAHGIICWFKNPRNAPSVPDDIHPGPGRWNITPESVDLDTLTFCGPGLYSVQLLGDGCRWHGNVLNGEAI